MNGYYPALGLTSLYQVIEQWEQFGVFTVLFPFILVFTVVFAILEKINLFRNKGVDILISLVIGFFTVTNPYISGFFMVLFSNLGLGVAILIVLMVLIGLAFKPNDKEWKYIFGIVGILIFLIIIGRTGLLRFLFGEGFFYWFSQNSGLVIIFLFVIIAIVAVVLGVKGEGDKTLGKLVGA